MNGVLSFIYNDDPVLARECLSEDYSNSRDETSPRAHPSLAMESPRSAVSAPVVREACGGGPGNSTVFYLSMIQYDHELMYTTARLFLHLSSTVERKRVARLEQLAALRRRQEEELAATLAMADAYVAPSALHSGSSSQGRSHGPLVVDSLCTESIFRRHAQEIEVLEHQHRDQAREALQEANEQFSSFLHAAAPDYLAHAMLSVGAGRSDASANTTAAAAAYRVAPSSVSEHPVSARPVDVLVLRVVNPLRGLVVGARPKDPTLSAIVLECSPLSQLAECNGLSQPCYVDEDHQERLARKVHDHLRRLAAGSHSVLFMIGHADEALDILGMQRLMVDSEQANADELHQACLPPELILPLCATDVDPLSCPPGGGRWSKIHASDLAYFTTTRLYAGNYVVLLDPSTIAKQGGNPCDGIRLRRAFRDALHFAMSHGATRFSAVALPSFAKGTHACVPAAASHPSEAKSPVLVSGDAATLVEVHHAVATVQLALNCGKPPSNTGLHICGLVHGLSEWRAMPAPLLALAGAAPFNLPIAIRCFLSAQPLDVAVAEAFQRDVEVIARHPVIQ